MNEIWIVFLMAILRVNVAVNAIRVVEKVPNESLNQSILDLKPQHQSNNNNPIVYPTRVEKISWKPRDGEIKFLISRNSLAPLLVLFLFHDHLPNSRFRSHSHPLSHIYICVCVKPTKLMTRRRWASRVIWYFLGSLLSVQEN
jgi:hypothetical protein